MKSKTKIKKQLNKKTNPILIETIRLAVKNKPWFKLAEMLSTPTRNFPIINLEDIEKKTSVGDTVVIPGKVLSSGEITKKIRICALSISKTAKEKLKKSKSEIISIYQEIKTNPKAEGIKILP